MLFNAKEWRSGLPNCIQPDLEYIAPEFGLRGNCYTKSDMYGLGVTIHAVYNQGKSVYQCHNSLASYKTLASEVSCLPFNCWVMKQGEGTILI